MITRIFIITIGAKKIFLTVTIVVYIAMHIAVTVRILGRLVVVFFVLEILKGLTNRPNFALDTPGGHRLKLSQLCVFLTQFCKF